MIFFLYYKAFFFQQIKTGILAQTPYLLYKHLLYKSTKKQVSIQMLSKFSYILVK